MKREIGQVFTPLKWAKWLINRWNIFDAWCHGAHICDPTSGEGVFIYAMLHLAKNKGISINSERLSRLSLIEMVPSHLNKFKMKIQRDFDVDFPTSQIFCQDIITEPHKHRYDILLGNPPWVNFSDLPNGDKNRLKPYFVKAGLVSDMQRLLLGSSRVDIAALVMKVVLGKLLKENGSGYFYLPTSLFFGEGAHNGFREFNANHRDFAVDTVYEFTSTQVFEGVSTAYCCASFRGDTHQEFPIPYFKEDDGKWVEHQALPLKNPHDPWRIVNNLDELHIGEKLDIKLPLEQKPRQGVNTCGVNSIFIFDEKPSHLPCEFLYPLATKELWRQNISTPIRWILLPYHRETGKQLTWNDIELYEGLRSYFQQYQDRLKTRKGTLLRTTINRGYWWTLLGVGPYSFAPYKVMWEAYGRDQFNPIVLSDVNGQMWQGNQAMHAFIPCWSEADAHRIKNELENPEIPILLRQLNGAGKCNWAQPGKMKKILAVGEVDNR